ncbi:hypothetical protein EDC40_105175 [Aminobacter aminovorans]|uniref:Uncharacterized protein n=1 Tax=Aminobacter aminovorans TaxID=83263 RepID=A0A380WNF0_AMIAI|nr:hypothetical protein [Aminobacter aminovorans]TCS25975.1 hypothetical protein EDC40_105175 [Aminobacter aminovorans]SUU90360.1 Uncharacterised protein [Aminobacter aminovorans]
MSGGDGRCRYTEVQPFARRCAALLALPLLFVTISPASAHRTASGWRYPPACCHGDIEHGECQAIPEKAVEEHGGGWSIVLEPGDHRKVTHRNRYFVPYGSEIPSGDGDYHICLHPTEEHENCFFVPPDAM